MKTKLQNIKAFAAAFSGLNFLPSFVTDISFYDPIPFQGFNYRIVIFYSPPSSEEK